MIDPLAHYGWRHLTEAQRATMIELIGAGWAKSLPIDEQRCGRVQVELRRLLVGGGRYYVAPDGTVRVGEALRQSQPVDTAWLRQEDGRR